MRIALILIIQLSSISIFSQNENNAITHNSEMASYFNSYDIIKVIKEEVDLEGFEQEELKQNDWNKEDNRYFNFNKVWVKKEIGYLAEFIKEFNISNWNEMKLKFSELEIDVDVKSSYFENLPHGYWDFGNYKGEFKNGKQEGEWILLKIESNPCLPDNIKNPGEQYTGEKIDTSIVHEFYKNGIADGQWFRIKNNIRENTFNFTNGKLAGEINVYGRNDAVIIFGDFLGHSPSKINMNFLNGIPNGNFTMSSVYFIKKGSYNLGFPIGKWEYSVNEWTDDGYRWNKNYYNIEIYENDFRIKESFFTSNSSDNFIKEYYVTNKNDELKQIHWFEYKVLVKDYQETRFNMTEKIENQKITSITFNGSDEFRNGKKEQAFYENGKLKLEGVVNQYRKEYDINGKLIGSSSQFNSLSDGYH